MSKKNAKAPLPRGLRKPRINTEIFKLVGVFMQAAEAETGTDIVHFMDNPDNDARGYAFAADWQTYITCAPKTRTKTNRAIVDQLGHMPFVIEFCDYGKLVGVAFRTAEEFNACVRALGEPAEGMRIDELGQTITIGKKHEGHLEAMGTAWGKLVNNYILS